LPEERNSEEKDSEHLEAGERDNPSSATRCLSCGGLPSWESTFDDWGERWLASCACGRIEAFFPDRRHPDQQPSDPLTLFLQGHLRPRRPATPPWVRLFLNSVQEPYSVRWRHGFKPCQECELPTTFGMLAWPRPYTAAICSVCINCGHVTASYSNPAAGTQEPMLDGTSWTPASPAVQRLRECVYRAVHHPSPVEPEATADP
jgi:hypothetical protein